MVYLLTLRSFVSSQATFQQFRKMGNCYFLCIGILMTVGTYTDLFKSAFFPTGTLGSLALMITFSLILEGYADVQRHLSDNATNHHPCTVLRRAEELEPRGKFEKRRKRDPLLNDGRDVKVRVAGDDLVPIAFESVRRMDIRAGELVYVRNRDMVPADLILLASSNDGGSAYVETSSIDGETNLKLRHSPHLPARRPGMAAAASGSLYLGGRGDPADDDVAGAAEPFGAAVARLARMSRLGRPDGVSALANPRDADERRPLAGPVATSTLRGAFERVKGRLRGDAEQDGAERRRSLPKPGEDVAYVASLTSEPPNAHIDNYTGTLTLPPDAPGQRSEHAPLGADNLLLRGAVLRNTDWVVGLACFTGADTKLVMNSVATPTKFSQLDVLINRCVLLVLFIMTVSCCSLGLLSVHYTEDRFDQLWYTGMAQARR